MLLGSVYLLLLLHFIRVPLSSFFFAVSRIHSLPLPLSSCLGCTPLLGGLPFLRSPLTRMFFLPYAYFTVVFLFVCGFCFVCTFNACGCLLSLCVSSASFPGNDVISWLLSCQFPSVYCPCFFHSSCSWFDFVLFPSISWPRLDS